MSVFYHAGSLAPDSPVHVGRSANIAKLISVSTVQHLRYAIVFGGPGLGKTSLMRRLGKSLSPHVSLYLLDLGGQPLHSDEALYSYITEQLLLRRPKTLPLHSVRRGADFQDFLRAFAPRRPTIIVLEHLSNLSEAVLKSFADVLRNTSETRYESGNGAFKRFSFILTGGVELYKSVGGSSVSPLTNISEQIYLEDLTSQESEQLLAYGLRAAQFSDESIKLLSDIIYAQVHGHPYLTQYLGDEVVQYLQPESIPGPDFIIDRTTSLMNNDLGFFSMLRKVQQEGLLDILREITLQSRQHVFARAIDPRVALLEAIGFIRAENRYCVIRNRAYEQRLKQEFAPSFPRTFKAIQIQEREKESGAPSSIVLFTLQLTRQQEALSFQVQVVASDEGASSSVVSTLPYEYDELTAVFKALLPLYMVQYPLQQHQIKTLQRLGLWNKRGGRPIMEAVKKVGQDLYKALMVGEVDTLFARVLSKAIHDGSTVAMQLRVDPSDVILARYPWELLYHHVHNSLLLGEHIELHRYMTYVTDNVSFPSIKGPLRVLYISSRPKGSSYMADEEQEAIKQALDTLQQTQQLEFTLLEHPTFARLREYLSTHSIDVLHFDGHGTFGRLCPVCGVVNHTRYTRCQNTRGEQRCLNDLSDVSPKGYLSFEDEEGYEKPIDSERLGYLVTKQHIRLAVLSACYSGTIDGNTMFSGTAQTLVREGVMAVVAAQMPISPKGATTFTHAFYQSLIETKSIPTAINRGRQSLLSYDCNEWFIPTLYTRTNVHELTLF